MNNELKIALISAILTLFAILCITSLAIIALQENAEPYIFVLCLVSISGLGGYQIKHSNFKKF